MSIYRIVTMQELIEATNFKHKVACDSETKGLYGKIRLLQVYQRDWDQVLIVENPNHLEVVSYMSKIHSIWHNAHYDFTTTAPRWSPDKFSDTFLLARIADPAHQEYSLDACMTRALGFDPYLKAGLNKKKLQGSDWSKPNLTDEQYLYAALDVYHLFEVYDRVSSAEDTQSYTLDKATLRKCLDFQWNGMPIQEHRIFEEYTAAIKRLKNIEWETPGVRWHYVHGQHSIPMPFNPRSAVQVREALGLESTAKTVLAEQSVAHGNKEAKNVMDARSEMKLIGFIEKYESFGERVYGKFKPSARSGRLTSDDENLQQIPRALKSLFGTTQDRVLIFSDYAQLELRTICAIIGVSAMEKLFRDGEDLHGYVASILFGEDYTKADRQVTKTYNFNLLYGGSVGMVLSILMTYGMYVDHRKATRHKRKWLNLFKELDKWQQECISKWRKGKLNSTPFGRSYKAKLMTDFMNIMNQGAGAEVAKLALHYFQPWLKENHPDVLICNFVHDSFILDCPNDPEVYQAVSIKLAECMQEAWFQMSKLYKIKDLPMPVDVKVGHNWGDIEKDKDIIWEYTLEPYKMLEAA
jgi:DNA polymerase I-like protein with 3'-5' exonuclease and polymerase domains